MQKETFRFKVGELDCLAINDSQHDYAASRFFTNVPKEKVNGILKEHNLDPAHLPSPYTCLFVDNGKNRVMIDTGVGRSESRLFDSLREEEIDVEEIDTVILTHGHHDHTGGVSDAEGNPRFPNAKYVMFKDEWDYWMTDTFKERTVLENQKPAFAEGIKQLLSTVESQMSLLDHETEIVSGMHAIDGSGHTPGQMIVALISGGEELLYISDTVLNLLHLEYPQWWTEYYDRDLAKANETKHQIFDRAVANNSLVLAFHFHPFPSLGHVVKKGEGWEWKPISVD